MSSRAYLFLFLFGLVVTSVISYFEPHPGYLDADYYYAGGIQLATGKGFNEPYLWNYLDGVSSLPHPSHSYWAPLSSIIAALGMRLTGQINFTSARLFFILIAAIVPPLTAALAYTFSQRRDLAVASGLLAVFSIYHAPFVGVTDNFSPFMLFGGLYFLVATQLLQDKNPNRNWLLLGILSGLMTLSRSDGLLWLGLTFLLALNQVKRSTFNVQRPSFILVLLGFLLVMSPWYNRNLSAYGTLMAPGGSRALWLANYDQTFIYPPEQLNLDSFLALGWEHILKDRLWALGNNLGSVFAAHSGIILFPFIVAGIIYYWKDERVKLATIAWSILFFVMTFLFPFAGARGAFFHAGAALQPMLWTLAPLGLEAVLDSLQKRGIGHGGNRFVFRSILIMVAMILTIFVVHYKLVNIGWGEGEDKDYPVLEQVLVQNGIRDDDIVIVRNAPGYYLMTGRSAVSIPYGGEEAILAVAEQFDAYYLALEPEAALEPIQDLFQNPDGSSQFIYLGEYNDTRIYRIHID